jgi:hypothetical protein
LFLLTGLETTTLLLVLSSGHAITTLVLLAFAAISLSLGFLFPLTTFLGHLTMAVAIIACLFSADVQGLTETVATLFYGDLFHVPAASFGWPCISADFIPRGATASSTFFLIITFL